MTDDAGHYGQNGPGGRPEQGEEPQRDPWAPPQETGPPKIPLQKTEPPPPGPGAADPYGPPAAPSPYPYPQSYQQPQPQQVGYGYAPPPRPSYPYPGYAQPGGMGGAPWMGGPSLPTGSSTAAMVLGIISMVLVMTCWGSFLAIVTSPIALGLGISARRRVAAGMQGGSGQATAGFIMGIIGTALSVLIAALIVILFIVAPKTDHSNDPYSTDDPYGFDAQGAVPALVVER